ncbi:TonB-dependent receptor [Mucilaginibacter auburnensis]|uniref:Iron complex outermembrane receptor protein n=1 Tax=Mucilaginibacter auburnensis TaxID=1457233 RepID=A0A2H9VVA5_9SPHI|nr:TonB-dependent receptor [Mucilaginibacter auburnensis]PJJ84719.1 iron complex outermembrane receptor protein [Mucilaginibacter auburnensis]
MKFKSLFSFFIAVIFPYFLFAGVAGSISGTLTDVKTGEKLPGGVITIAQLRLSTTTDADGKFSFTSLPSKGRYVVEARYSGYKTQVKTVDLAAGADLNFALERSIVEIREVVITGTPITSSNKSNSTSASSVSREELLTSSTNLIDALARQVPGMSQITTGGAISKPVIRGLSYNRVVTLSNGVKQQGQQWGDEHGIELDQNQADRVEVLRGAASLLYGSDAIGGVINVLDPLVPSPGKIKGEFLSSYATNNGLTNTSLMLSGNSNGFVWRGRGSYQNAGDFKTPAGYYINSGFNNTSLSGMLGLNKEWGYSHLNFSYFKNNIGFNDAEPGDQLYTDIAGGRKLDFPRQDIRHYKLALNNNFIIGNNTLKLDLGYQKNQRRELESADPALFFDLNTFSADAKYYLGEANGWQPIIGLSASNESSKNKGYEYLIPEYDQTSVGAFVYVKKSWDKNTFNAGIRFDHINNDGKQFFVEGEEKFPGFKNRFSNVSGALGFTHLFSEGVTFKANAGSAFRAPNPAELGSNGAHEGTIRYEIGNPNLKPERSYQADATLDFDGKVISGSIGVSQNYINNYIYASAVPGQQITETDEDGNTKNFDVYRYGQVNANLYGVEGSLNLHPAEFLHFDNTFSYTHAQNKTFDRPLALIPAGTIRNTLRFEPKVNGLNSFFVSVGVDNFFSQNRVDPTFETTAGGYTLLNAGIGAGFKMGKQAFKLAVSGNNLTNRRYYDALNRLRPGRLALTNPTFGVYNPGRNVTFSLFVPLNIN